MYEPHKRGDIILDDDGNRVAYTGPQYELHFPPPSQGNQPNPFEETQDLSHLGYFVERWRVPLGKNANEKLKEKGFFLRILGDITEDLEEKLTQRGIIIKLVKERGEEIPLPVNLK